MKPLPILTTPTSRYHILPTGEMIDTLAVRYDAKVNLQNLTYTSITDEDYNECDLPTLNELYKTNQIKQGTCIEKECRVDYPNKTHLKDADIKKIIKKFKEQGFDISDVAIKHNFDAWNYGFKSGYRDTENNYHLFTPCGANPLSFRATSLHKQCEDWQTTYVC